MLGGGSLGLYKCSIRVGEDYKDPDSLIVLMDTGCPASDEAEVVLAGREEYGEMVFTA